MIPQETMALTISYTSTKQFNIPKGIGWVAAAFGAFFLIVLMVKDLRLVVFGTKTQGVVQPAERQPGEKFKFTVQFKLPDGAETQIQTSPTWGSRHEPGEIVPIIYLPSNPSKAEINTLRQLILPMFTGMFAASLALGFGLMLIAMRSREKAARRTVQHPH